MNHYNDYTRTIQLEMERFNMNPIIQRYIRKSERPFRKNQITRINRIIQRYIKERTVKAKVVPIVYFLRVYLGWI